MPAEAGIDLDPDLLWDVLQPYADDCKYVKGGTVRRHGDAVILDAQLSIGPSCYLLEPEPFQPAEFNICYNQMLYLVLAQGVVSGLYPELAVWDYAEFKRHQLPDVLILDFLCHFGEPPVRRDAFRGSLTVEKVILKRTLTLLKTSCEFTDDHDGYAEGVVTIGIVHSAPQIA